MENGLLPYQLISNELNKKEYVYNYNNLSKDEIKEKIRKMTKIIEVCAKIVENNSDYFSLELKEAINKSNYKPKTRKVLKRVLVEEANLKDEALLTILRENSSEKALMIEELTLFDNNNFVEDDTDKLIQEDREKIEGIVKKDNDLDLELEEDLELDDELELFEKELLESEIEELKEKLKDSEEKRIDFYTTIKADFEEFKEEIESLNKEIEKLNKEIDLESKDNLQLRKIIKAYQAIYENSWSDNYKA